MLRDNLDLLHRVAGFLLKHETMDGTQFEALFNGQEPVVEVPAQETPAAEEVPTEQPVAEDVPAEEAPVQETPAESESQE
jgi:hypothetical protein